MSKEGHWFNQIYRVVKKINYVAVNIPAILILLLTVIIFYDIVMRYIFNSPTLWALEISTYLLLFITFASASYTLQVDGHVNIDLLLVRCKPRTRRILILIAFPFGLMFCLVLGWQSWRLFFAAYRENWISNFALATPLKYPYLIMPIGMLMLIITYLLKSLEIILKRPEPLEDPKSVITHTKSDG